LRPWPVRRPYELRTSVCSYNIHTYIHTCTRSLHRHYKACSRIELFRRQLPSCYLRIACMKVKDASGQRSSCLGWPTRLVGGICQRNDRARGVFVSWAGRLCQLSATVFLTVTAVVSATGRRSSSKTRCGRSRRPNLQAQHY
jgi:hypothetical protein